MALLLKDCEGTASKPKHMAGIDDSKCVFRWHLLNMGANFLDLSLSSTRASFQSLRWGMPTLHTVARCA